jgi:hypothetical protein
VGIRGDISIGAYEESGAKSDHRDIKRLSLVARRLEPDLPDGAIDDANYRGLAIHCQAFAVRHGAHDERALGRKQCCDQEKSACRNKKQSAHIGGSLGVMVSSQRCAGVLLKEFETKVNEKGLGGFCHKEPQEALLFETK